MAKRALPEINAGSMADIAFLLLIFFLVATTMNVDSGIQRRLPPIQENKNDKGIDVNQRNLFPVFINTADMILVNGKPLTVLELRAKAKEFVSNPYKDPSLSDVEMKKIDLLGEYPVSKGVISLQNDRGTTYKTYLRVQNELVAAFNELRNTLAKEKFGKDFKDLVEKEREAIQSAIPQKISEAEPRNIGGN